MCVPESPFLWVGELSALFLPPFMNKILRIEQGIHIICKSSRKNKSAHAAKPADCCAHA